MLPGLVVCGAAARIMFQTIGLAVRGVARLCITKNSFACHAALTRQAPLLFNQTSLLFSSKEYHQPTRLSNTSSSEHPINSARCLNVPSIVVPTASILRTLIIPMYCTTIQLPMIGLNSWPGYHPWSPSYGIETSKSAVSTASGNGS